MSHMTSDSAKLREGETIDAHTLHGILNIF
jgi:hypothetical protein